MGPPGGLGYRAIVGQADGLSYGAITSHADDLTRGGTIMRERSEKHKKVDIQGD